MLKFFLNPYLLRNKHMLIYLFSKSTEIIWIVIVLLYFCVS